MATGPLAHLSGANGADVKQEGAQTIGPAEGRRGTNYESWSRELPRPFAPDSKKVH